MLNEATIEESIISLLQAKGFEFLDFDNDWLIERSLDEFVNREILYESLTKINKINDGEIINEAINRLTRVDNPSLFERNFLIHKMLLEGVTIESSKYKVNPLIKFIDFKTIDNNTFQVVHQVKFLKDLGKFFFKIHTLKF